MLHKFATNWTSGWTVRICQFYHNHFHVVANLLILDISSRPFFFPRSGLTRNFEGLPRIETQKILMDIPSEAVAHCTLLSNQYHDMAVLSVHEKPAKHTRKRCPIFCLVILILRQFPSAKASTQQSNQLTFRLDLRKLILKSRKFRKREKSVLKLRK